MDMNQFYHGLVSKEERHLVELIEPFDEYEEWNLKCSHYMVLCGYNGASRHLLDGLYSIVYLVSYQNILLEN